MNALTIMSVTPMMTSIKLLDFVNEARVEFNEAQVRHNDFLSRCKSELAEEPYETFVEPPRKTAEGQIPAFEAIRMTADQCRLVAMRESKGVRRRVLARLKELEAQAAAGAFQIPTTLSGALRLAAQQAEQQKDQLALAAPKVEFVDLYVESTGIKCFREVAKLLKANESHLREYLIENRIMYRLNGKLTARQPHIAAGRFEVKTGTSERNGHSFTETKFTPEGVNWIAGLWAVYCLRDAA